MVNVIFVVSVGSDANNLPLYIGLAVAIVVFTLVAGVIYRILRRKDRDHSLYNKARSSNYINYLINY